MVYTNVVYEGGHYAQIWLSAAIISSLDSEKMAFNSEKSRFPIHCVKQQL